MASYVYTYLMPCLIANVYISGVNKYEYIVYDYRV